MKKVHILLFLTTFISIKLLSFTDLESAQEELKKAAQIPTTNSEQKKLPCLCDPALYARIIIAHPEAATTKLTISNGKLINPLLYTATTSHSQLTNPLLYAATICPAKAVEQMIKTNIENCVPVNEVTYQIIPPEPVRITPDNKFSVILRQQPDVPVHDSNLLHLIAARVDWRCQEDLATFERIVKMLIKNGVDINQVNLNRKSPLFIQNFDVNNPDIPHGQTERAKILIENGAQAQWWISADALWQIKEAIQQLEAQGTPSENPILKKLKTYADLLAHYKPKKNS